MKNLLGWYCGNYLNVEWFSSLLNVPVMIKYGPLAQLILLSSVMSTPPPPIIDKHHMHK